MDKLDWAQKTIEAGYWSLSDVRETEGDYKGKVTIDFATYEVGYPKSIAKEIKKLFEEEPIWIDNVIDLYGDTMIIRDIYLQPFEKETLIRITEEKERTVIHCTNSEKKGELIYAILKLENWYREKSNGNLKYSLGKKLLYDIRIVPHLPKTIRDSISLLDYKIGDYFKETAVVVTLSLHHIHTFKDLVSLREEEVGARLHPKAFRAVMEGCRELGLSFRK